ncbi:unnamed protein product [Calicophoron daubneyi]|uniref:Uncharacterized protein n=1 Tax=Calicophoron daubneyi TaxID=300641 RepID=A0AAV2T5A6_CALDB
MSASPTQFQGLLIASVLAQTVHAADTNPNSGGLGPVGQGILLGVGLFIGLLAVLIFLICCCCKPEEKVESVRLEFDNSKQGTSLDQNKPAATELVVMTLKVSSDSSPPVGTSQTSLVVAN